MSLLHTGFTVLSMKRSWIGKGEQSINQSDLSDFGIV